MKHSRADGIKYQCSVWGAYKNVCLISLPYNNIVALNKNNRKQNSLKKKIKKNEND